MRTEEQLTATDAASPRPSLFRHSDFMKLWAGETVSDFGSRMGDVAISFAAVIALKATPFQMGLLAAARIVPALLFGLFAGVWVDKLRRRPLMIGADLGRVALFATIPLAAYFGTFRIAHLYAVITAVAVLDIVFDVAYRSYLPSLVSRGDLLDANSKLTGSSAVSEVAGFGLSGWLVQLLTAPFAILVDAISFLPSAIAIAAIKTPEPEPARAARRGMLHEIAIGARHVVADPCLRALGVVALTGATSYSIFSAVFMLFVVNGLGFQPGALGLIFAVGGVASLFGAIFAQRAASALGAGRAMSAGLALQGVALLFIPLAHGAALAAVTLLIAQQIVGDLAGTIYQINATSLKQSITPEHVLGRVNASLGFVSRASALVGALGGGLLGSAIGLRATLVIGSAGLFVSALLLARSPAGSFDVSSFEDNAPVPSPVADRPLPVEGATASE
ncbi:MAG TPA: MFS transporter [Candidatus Binataceae bacterium]